MALDKVRAKLEAVERQKSEPIAVIGMACRFPGGADTPETFFRLLEAGKDTVSSVPAGRWPLPDGSADPARRGARWGAWLRGVDQFDASFFGISPPEATQMDPQQRLLLELTWEALERGGQSPERLMGSSTGVFVGVTNADYMLLSLGAPAQTWDPYLGPGTGHSFPAGRIAYTFGFQGPAMAVDTAGSSSLTATHLACQSLRSGDSTLAIVGGVNLMLSPVTTAITASTGALAPDGRCRAFDAQANGYVRGEGCGVLVLKLLSDAQRDGNPVLALLRGSAVAQNGRSAGITTPNTLAQQALIRQALANARVAPEDIGYVETHGSGERLGDLLELEALRAVLGEPRFQESPCVLGAVKTNIGHLEAAAGMAGLIKTVMVLERETIPRNLHFRALSPSISLEGTPFAIPTENRPWPRGAIPRLAGVSAFGSSGTNAHVIVEEAPPAPVDDSVEREASSYLLPISARSPAALQALAVAYAQMLAGADGTALGNIVYTASARRAHHPHRLAITGRTREELARALASPEVADGARSSTAVSRRPGLVFVFSGQGSAWVGMGRQLLTEEPVFRAKLEQCSEVLRRYVSWSLLDELMAPPNRSRFAETKVAGPALFAMQVGLVKLLKSWGIGADAVIGQDVGEIAAAHVAGVLPLDEAARLVAWRSRLLQKGVVVAGELEETLGRLPMTRGVVPFYSTVTGSVIDGESLDASYWDRNARAPAQLAPAVAAAFADGHRLFLEVGPHPVLAASLVECFAAEREEGLAVSTLRQQSDERLAILEALGTLYVRGVDPDWRVVHGTEGRCVPLPAVPWQRQRFWLPHA